MNPRLGSKAGRRIDRDSEKKKLRITISALFRYTTYRVSLVVRPEAPHMPGTILAAKPNDQVPSINYHRVDILVPPPHFRLLGTNHIILTRSPDAPPATLPRIERPYRQVTTRDRLVRRPQRANPGRPQTR